MIQKIMIGQLLRINRLSNSVDGNPRFELDLDGVRYRTKKDALCAYEIAPTAHEGERVVLHLDGNNQVIEYRLAPKREA